MHIGTGIFFALPVLLHADVSAAELAKTLEEVIESGDHQWSIGRMDPEERARRDKRQKEFLDRYN